MIDDLLHGKLADARELHEFIDNLLVVLVILLHILEGIVCEFAFESSRFKELQLQEIMLSVRLAMCTYEPAIALRGD